MGNLREECGVFGIFSGPDQDVASAAYYALFSLQHRGQESAGIVVNDDGVFRTYKDSGLVNDVFTPRVMESLGTGNMAVGHVRYGTSGSSDRSNAQPMVVNHVKGRMALAHNGSLVNSDELRRELELTGSIFQTTSDTEVISYLITKERLTCGSIEEAVNRAMDRIDGAYSLVVMSPQKLIAARDENGFRPLCFGQCDDGSYVVASETCALDAVGAQFIRDLEPGELVVFDKNGYRSIRDHCGKRKESFCVFEYIYFARLDSKLDGISVYESRLRAGAALAKAYPADADLVVGVPDSGITAAQGFAAESGIPFGLAFYKNSYVGRTFIKPTQKERESSVRLKLSVLESAVKGKNIVLVDDSIVRGTTIANLIHLLKHAGAKEVHVRVSSPPFLYPCYFGTDVPSNQLLIASSHSTEEIRQLIGADSLGYMKIEDLQSMVGDLPLCRACFDNHYPMDIPNQ